MNPEFSSNFRYTVQIYIYIVFVGKPKRLDPLARLALTLILAFLQT